jgi:hypothetical protein
MESKIFWLIATFACVLAFGFAFKQGRLIAKVSPTACAGLARSQEKDNWLTCIVVWGVILGGRSDFSEWLQWVGSPILGWLAWRTLRRVALLQRQHSETWGDQ